MILPLHPPWSIYQFIHSSIHSNRVFRARAGSGVWAGCELDMGTDNGRIRLNFLDEPDEPKRKGFFSKLFGMK